MVCRVVWLLFSGDADLLSVSGMLLVCRVVGLHRSGCGSHGVCVAMGVGVGYSRVVWAVCSCLRLLARCSCPGRWVLLSWVVW